MTKFIELSLHELLLKNLAHIGYDTPTPIQAQSIPLAIEGHDILGIAQTGTGKTASFSLPILHQLITNNVERKKHEPKVLILAPTRELCSQINESMEIYAKNTKYRTTAIYGGVGQKPQIEALRNGTEIVVATPGRLLDLLNQKHLTLNSVEYFVLDEADRMLDMGFIDDIKKIISRLPGKKQTMLFSATMPKEIAHLADKILKNPKRVEVARASTVANNITQKVYFLKKNHKYELLKNILKEDTSELVLVFTRTKRNANQVVEYLQQEKIPSRAIHGNKSQNAREMAISQFKDGAVKVLIATDIASRGIDIEGVTHVINFDVPMDPESYVHRIGRTARAGRDGIAISFCDDSEKEVLRKIQRLIKMEIPSETFVGTKEVNVKLKRAKPPTPGKSQEKNAWIDHSKRQKVLKPGEKPQHPGFRKKKRRRF